jgi:ABC-type bacteriocin/lantibiotic exporter with double-glycine peptidase domain
MKYQERAYSCGAAAVVNALRCFGTKITEVKVRHLAGTTKADGTSKDGMLQALSELNFEGELIDTVDEDDAWKEIVYGIEIGHPVIICISNLQHWVTVVGKLGNKFLIIDPTGAKNNKKENGVKILSKGELITKWKSRGGNFLGVVCKK